MPDLTDDQRNLLALYAASAGPVALGWLVVVLSPPPEGTSWRRPWRHWRAMTAWVARNEEIASEAAVLARRGLLRCVRRNRWSELKSVYEITGLGRDVAARNAAVLMNHLTEERA